MKILEKFSGSYRESIFDRAKRNQQNEVAKKAVVSNENFNSSDLNEATVFFSRHQSNKKIDGIEEAYKLLDEMTRYLQDATQEGKAVELTNNMHFDTKKIAAILVS